MVTVQILFMSGVYDYEPLHHLIYTLIARFMGPTWGTSGADRTQVCPISAPWTLLSGQFTTWRLEPVQFLTKKNKTDPLYLFTADASLSIFTMVLWYAYCIDTMHNMGECNKFKHILLSYYTLYPFHVMYCNVSRMHNDDHISFTITSFVD